MKKLLLPFALILVLLNACSSGKKAYERGDYATAVYQAVDRLRQKPDHTKSQDALRLAYPLAVDYLESQANLVIASNEPFKWKKAIGYYQQINQLQNQIKTSPAALQVIRNPVSKHAEIADLKKKAAEESYEAGIQSMMKGTRGGAIQAYYLFKEANEFDPGIKDVVELQSRAEYDATLRIVYTEQVYRNEWVATEPVINGLQLPFTRFYTPAQAESEKAPIHHTLLVEVMGYSEGRPSTTKSENIHKDSVAVDRIVAGKKVKVYEPITGRSTLYEKKAASQGTIRVTIKERETAKQLMNNEINGIGNWTGGWARCSGDNRAIPERIRKTCSQSEPEPDSQAMLKQARADVMKQLESTLSSFYRL